MREVSKAFSTTNRCRNNLKDKTMDDPQERSQSLLWEILRDLMWKKSTVCTVNT